MNWWWLLMIWPAWGWVVMSRSGGLLDFRRGRIASTLYGWCLLVVVGGLLGPITSIFLLPGWMEGRR